MVSRKCRSASSRQSIGPIDSLRAAGLILRELVNPPAATTPHPADLEAARRRDEAAFERLVGPHRGELQAHCYRMLGSAADAEDALQETLLRASRGLPSFEGRSSLRSWLYRIATNASLRLIEKRPKRVLPIDYGPPADPHAAFGEPLTESIWLEPYPDADLDVEAALLGPDARYEQRESIELAFAAAFQHLPARQRAVLILRDVLGFSARETAEALEMTPVSVGSALQRAHKAIEERVPGRTQQATLRGLGDSELRQIVTRFADAWERHDVDGVVTMLTDDARMTMPPWPSWYRGRDAIATFLRSWPLSHRKRWQFLHTGANGQPAVAGYLSDEQRTAFRPETIIVLTFQAARIVEITAFRSPELFPRFGLPEQLTNDIGAPTALAPASASLHVRLASPRSIEEDTP
jgi:RNA polymerase sigma-70 factor, ECF subfamily